MANTLPNGVVVPEGADPISASGVAEIRALGASVDTALGGRALVGHTHTVDQVTDFADAVSGFANIEPTDLEVLDLNTVTTPGKYSQQFSSRASVELNYPPDGARAGRLTVQANASRSQVTQMYWTYDTSSLQALFVRNYYQSWGEWKSIALVSEGEAGGGSGGLVAEELGDVHLDTVLTPGSWSQSFAAYATVEQGYPGGVAGRLLVLANPLGSQITQIYIDFTPTALGMYVRNYYSSWGEWFPLATGDDNGGGGEPTTGSHAIESDVQISDHATRVEIAASRRGGSIGTAGLPVFMWRFDHWLVAFRDKILPILQEFDLPATLNVNYDNMDNVQNGGGSITWEHVQEWNQYDGVEIANHGATHTNASTRDDIFHEIVEGRRLLETAMPRVAVETWQEHGSAYLTASDVPGDTGLDLGRTPEAFTQSYAGRLVMAEHAVVEGKFGSFYPPLTGKPQIGQSHYSMDRQTAAEAIETIQYVQQVGRGMTGYTHPGLMDQVNVGGSLFPATYNTDGSVDFEGTHYATEAEFRTAQDAAGNIVHMPSKDFAEVCEWLAGERDAGRLMVMTAAGGGFADKHHDRRENILIESSWSGSGWTVSGAGDSWVADSTADPWTLTQGLLLYTRFGWAMGAAHELLVHAKSDVDTTLTIAMEQMGDPTNWATAKTHTVPGDGVLRPYRLNLTLPRDRSITQMRVNIDGASLQIHGAPLLAAI